ncbi:MAG TPA: cadherin repeat domain-containing protein [Pyrinomonadaceae bacterium]|nr:cadherin repeat domain-containing protein [Pyrinomonadaceae bacterium]
MNDKRPVITTGQSFNVPDWPGTSVGTAAATDGDASDTLQNWQVTGGSGAYKFRINLSTGQITFDRSILDGSAQTYTLSLLVGDGKLPSHVENVTINVPADTAAPVPDATALPDVTGECSAAITGPAPTATDAYVGPVTGTTTDPLGYSTQGEHVVTWHFDDGHGNVSTQTQKVIVKDVTAPTILSLSASPNVLGPPNHQMIPVNLSAAAADNCDPAPVTRIIAVASNEPVNGNGDGNTSPDWIVTGNRTLNLRAERAGGSSSLAEIFTTETQRHSLKRC